MRDENTLRCPKCGAIVISQASERHCYKCETPMILIKTEKGKWKEKGEGRNKR